MTSIEAPFLCAGTRCAGTLHLPAAATPHGVIIMAHGFGAIRAAGLRRFAERFVEAGYAAFLFDYRTFGDSEGTPRHWASPARHLQDWSAAIAHVRRLTEVQGAPVVLWGSSFGGGHVLQTAAFTAGIAGVISQVPHVSGVASLLQVPARIALKLTLAGLFDLAGSVLGRPYYRPIVGHPGDTAALASAECWDGYLRLFPQGARWNNKVLARVFLQLPWYSPGRHAIRIKVPTLMVVGMHDTVTPAAAARRAASLIRDCEFRALNCDHFAPYDKAFEENIRLQLDFLQRKILLAQPMIAWQEPASIA